MSEDTTADVDEILEQSKNQKRHTSEPTTQENTQQSVDRVDAIREALLAIQDDDLPENINIRDERLKALLVGLEDAGELDDVATTLAEVLDADVETDDATQSDVARLLIRAALQEALPDLLDDARDARRQAVMEQANDF